MTSGDFRGVFWAYVLGLVVVVATACSGARPAAYGLGLAECSNRTTAPEAEACCEAVTRGFNQDPTFCHVSLAPPARPVVDAGSDAAVSEAPEAGTPDVAPVVLPNPYEAGTPDAAPVVLPNPYEADAGLDSGSDAH